MNYYKRLIKQEICLHDVVLNEALGQLYQSHLLKRTLI
jgi:hypothetical protein